MIRTLIASLTDLVGARASLAAVGIAEEVERHRRSLMLGILGGAFACSALLMATIAVAVIFWDTHRAAALIALTLVHVACSAFALLQLRAGARNAAREKQLLLMRSTLARLRLELAAQRIRRSPGVALVTRLASIAQIGRNLFSSRHVAPTVRYRTDGAGRAAYAPVSTKEQSK